MSYEWNVLNFVPNVNCSIRLVNFLNDKTVIVTMLSEPLLFITTENGTATEVHVKVQRRRDFDKHENEKKLLPWLLKM